MLKKGDQNNTASLTRQTSINETIEKMECV